mgnify:CR=1 FL=1
MLHFGRCERRRRFIQNQDARLERKRLGNLDKLLFRHRQVADGNVQGNGDAELLHDLVGALAHRRSLHEAEPVAEFARQKHVLDRVQVGDKRKLLKHDADAGIDRFVVVTEMTQLAIDPDLAFARLENAAQDLHQRRLAGAVFSEKGMNLARLDGQIHAVQDLYLAEAFLDATQLQHWCLPGSKTGKSPPP